MVQLVLSTTKGKSALRFYPYHGHLGYSPVTVQGVVRTVLDDAKNLPASSITIAVRCIESRIGLRSNESRVLADYSKVLWSKPDDQEFADVSALELPFRLTIPTDSPGFSTSLFVEYRCIWRIQAVLNHIPISGIGHRQVRQFQIPLVSYALPPCTPTPSFTRPPLHQQTHKLGAPSVRYTVNAPTTPIGPLGIVSLPIYVLPLDPAITVRSASAIVERRIQFNPHPKDPIPTSSSTTSLSSCSSPLDPSASLALSDNSSNPTITPGTVYPSVASSNQPLLPPTLPSSDPVPQSASTVFQIATTESSGVFSFDPVSGVYSKTLTLQWPESRSHSRWHVGSTLNSDLVSIRFYVRTKIVVAGSSSSNTHTLELAEQELLIVPINETERSMASIHSVSDTDNSRSKSKSPRRSRRDDPSEGEEAPPLPEAGSSRHRSKPSSSSAISSQPPRLKRRAPKRPHTSNGVPESSASSSSPPLSPSFTQAKDKSGTPKRWVSAAATVPTPERRPTQPDKSPTKSFIPFLGPPKVASTPSGDSSNSSAVGGSTSSMSSEGSASRSDRSDADEDDVFDSVRQPSKRRMWLRGRSTATVRDQSTSKAVDSSPSTPSGETPPSPLLHREIIPPSSDPDAQKAAHIRSWEEELSRIETASRRSSNMLLVGPKARKTPS